MIVDIEIGAATVKMKRTNGRERNLVNQGPVPKIEEETTDLRAMIVDIEIGMRQDLTKDRDVIAAGMRRLKSKRKGKALSEAASVGRPIKGTEMNQGVTRLK